MSMTVAKHLFVHVSSELQVQENNHLKKKKTRKPAAEKKKERNEDGIVLVDVCTWSTLKKWKGFIVEKSQSLHQQHNCGSEEK